MDGKGGCQGWMSRVDSQGELQKWMAGLDVKDGWPGWMTRGDVNGECAYSPGGRYGGAARRGSQQVRVSGILGNK